jgi:tetratricopeptide (TPR) repeat protein
MVVIAIATPDTIANDSTAAGGNRNPERRACIIRLDGIARAAIFLLVIAILGTAYSAMALRLWWAAHLAAGASRQQLELALRFNPGNAEYHARLGQQYLFAEQDASAAAAAFRAAVGLNPYPGRYWLDLASADQVLGDAAAEQNAVERAVQAEPTSPDVLWDAAGHYLLLGDTVRSMHLMRAVMEYRPEASYRGLELLWRSVSNVDAILADAVPPTPDVHLAFISFLTRKNQAAAAARVWKHLVALGKPIRPTAALFYFDYLIEHEQPEQAHDVWKDLCRVDSLDATRDAKELVTNGGFERVATNGGFDWRFSINNEGFPSVDSDESHSGTRSAKFKFEGEISGDLGLWQYVLLQPNSRYAFRAYVKTNDLRGATMPAFALVDGYPPSTVYLTAAVPEGTGGWTLIEKDFLTGAETRLAVLTMRALGRRVVLGELWIDDISISRR